MIRPALARKYAQALVFVAQKKGVLDRVVAEVGSVATLAAQPDLHAALTAVSYPEEARKGLLSALFGQLHPEGVDSITKNFVATLELHHRLGDFLAIADKLQRAVDDTRGVVRAKVTTAVPMDPADASAAEAALAAVTGSKVRLETAVDPELLGGAVAAVGSTIYDGSVRTGLERLKARVAGGEAL